MPSHNTHSRKTDKYARARKCICCSCNASILEEYRWQLRIETVPQSLASCRTAYNMILSISKNISEDSNHPCSIDKSNNYRHMDIRAMPTKTEATAQQWSAYSKVNEIILCNFWNAIYPTNTHKHAFKHISWQTSRKQNSNKNNTQRLSQIWGSCKLENFPSIFCCKIDGQHSCNPFWTVVESYSKLQGLYQHVIP